METEKLRILREILGHERKSNEERLFGCPYCDHHKSKLSVNIKKNVYKCWVCDSRGSNIYHLVRKFGAYKHRQAWLQFEEEIDYSSFEELFGKKEEVEQTIPLPTEYISLANKKFPPTGFMARKYLKERGISKEEIIWWKIGYCSSGEYENRIIIPSFNENGDVNYFISRSYNGGYPKYKNPPVDRDVVFNDLFIDWTDDITLVEGIFDAIVAGSNSIPLLGSILRMDSRLFQKIVKTGASVYMALDPDAERKSLEIIKNFLTYDVELYKVDIHPYKDVGEMSRDEFKERKKKATRMNFDKVLQQSILV
jgi:transcription elongation factor Elf1